MCPIAVSVLLRSFCVSYFSFCDVEIPVCVLLQSLVPMRCFSVSYCSLYAVEVLLCVLLQSLYC